MFTQDHPSQSMINIRVYAKTLFWLSFLRFGSRKLKIEKKREVSNQNYGLKGSPKKKSFAPATINNDNREETASQIHQYQAENSSFDISGASIGNQALKNYLGDHFSRKDSGIRGRKREKLSFGPFGASKIFHNSLF